MPSVTASDSDTGFREGVRLGESLGCRFRVLPVAGSSVRWNADHVAPQEPRRLELEIRFDAEPIEGRVHDDREGGRSRPFSGWLGLIAAIEAAQGVDAATSKRKAATREQ